LYLYLDADDEFARTARGGAARIELEYLDRGQGAIVLEYDSSDASAPYAGAYKAHPLAPPRTNSGQWRTAAFELRDPRFAGSQNGQADFRFYNGGDDLLVKAVKVKRLP
jgi:hypothetical protein